MRKILALGLAGLMLNPAVLGANPVPPWNPDPQTTTRIKHLVIIFQENVSFDHYFGTYPNAANPSGEPAFHAKKDTPSVNGLSGGLLTANPNLFNTANLAGAANPFRLDRSQAATADQGHNYTPEQLAFDKGLLDLFPLSVGTAGPPPGAPPAAVSTKGLVMGYYDGNTVTALWNYAQHFAMSDNSYNTTFGPSTPGAINVVSGQTDGVTTALNATGSVISDGGSSMTDINDNDPIGDVCSTTTGARTQFSGKNIGDLLNAKGITWGMFTGGFDLSLTNVDPVTKVATTGCKRATTSTITNVSKADYIPHHEPFQYYASTANPTHVRPSSVSMIGRPGDAGNHQYDIHDFFDAINAGNFPAVSYLKAPGFQDGHAGYSDPLDEQTFIVNTINFLQQRPEWESTAVIISYDDSDGWYDHQMGPIVNPSTTPSDALTGPGACGNGAFALPGFDGTNLHAQGRCGYGPRLPLLVISPWARSNFVDHATTDQSSIVRFIEDNWLDSERIIGSFDAIAGSLENMFDFKRDDCRADRLFLNPSTGEIVGDHNHDRDDDQGGSDVRRY